MKTFKEWLEQRSPLDSRAAKTGVGALLGGTVGAAIGYSMGDTGPKAAQPGVNRARVGELMTWHQRQSDDAKARQKAWEDDLRAKGHTDQEIFAMHRRKEEEDRKANQEKMRRDRLGILGRAKERLFGRPEGTK